MASQVVVDARNARIESAGCQQGKVTTEAILTYIDQINTPRQINPLELVPQLEETFNLSRREANRYILLWLRTFAERYLDQKEADISGN